MSNGEKSGANLSGEVVDLLHEFAERRPETLTPVLRRAIAVEQHLRDQAAGNNFGPEDPLPPAA